MTDPSPAQRLVLSASVNYADVDRREVMLLPRLFKLLQEAAIMHANQHGAGTDVRVARAEGWVLNRIATAIERYPRHGETLRIETWSSGIKGFKGYRDFRILDADERAIVQASSLWLYINVRTKSIVRVPREIAERFPVAAAGAWCAELEALAFEAPASDAVIVPVGVRYSDFDVNEHVNNAAYLDFVQTALARTGATVYPRRVRVKFARAIEAGCERVDVRLERRGDGARFSVTAGETVCAQGEAEA